MHPLFVPPEAREPTGTRALPTARKPWGWTVERVAMISLLAVTASATASVTFELASLVAPCTTLVAYAFWRVGRRITQPGHMWLYCFGGGAVAGALNGWLTLAVWLILDRGEPIPELDLDSLGTAALFGAMVGFVYGFAYLLPMLTQLSARSLRRTEGIDRCLVGYGLWGVLVLSLGFRVARDNPSRQEFFLIAVAIAVLHGWMALVGTLRWARRRWWLGRVLHGKVAGWLVCDSQRFHAAELEGLQVFCSPPFTSPLAESLSVLAWADPSNAYRATPLTPKYWVAAYPPGNTAPVESVPPRGAPAPRPTRSARSH